jgi:diadenosine tetraphosphate (Ap4A) HIT family hydrolase
VTVRIDPDCPFCRPEGELLYECHDVVAFLDQYPVTRGHALIVPRTHIQRWEDLDEIHQRALMRAITPVMMAVDDRQSSDASLWVEGFNVGFNDGAAAGQTIEHFHIHVIPRRAGDVEDPRGGIRWVIPGKANYWD